MKKRQRHLTSLGSLCDAIRKGLPLRGYWDVECLNRDGSVAWRERVPNGATYVGINDMLNVTFGGGTQKPSWYLGVISATSYSGLASSDTMSSHSGWAEFTDYNEATRPQWVPASAVAGRVDDSGTTQVTNTTAGNQVQGFFVASNSTKSGTTGILWATGTFEATRTLSASQVLRVPYYISVG